MSAIFVVFPPGAGGNHLKNIVVSCLGIDHKIDWLYAKKTPTKHARVGSNLQSINIQNALDHQDCVHVLHGHFGEIMSYQNQIRSIADKKFVILSPDTVNDRKLLNNRRKNLKHRHTFFAEDYFDQEQVFLYEPFMYHYYFQVPMEDIMNISITEWFTHDINGILDRLSWLLKININKTDVAQMHCRWLEDNNL